MAVFNPGCGGSAMTQDFRLAPVEAYLRRHPDAPGLARLRDQMNTPDSMFPRTNMTGHITASGFVLTPDRSETLLIGHRGLGRWLQPGAHLDDGDTAIWSAAQREICEETGLAGLALDPCHIAHGHDFEPADIDTHEIPPRPAKGEGAHLHHDCLYIFVAPKVLITPEEDAIFAACWCPIDDPRVPARLQRVYAGL
jgi:8-oxo-dGTP pyrophosphatase MutT (NUDIX family)